ncbi:hypothetical protein DFQ04_2214 [Algoriphagus boseongensis]|uniref:Uncharacterized protein n=1 Tax=Algoriphagus boseongensis TaxID=1442587 RepID=A0A4R6T698_9BACT|nr:hypothetical protein DFQ04_2214 [Algoriphagus boseongensis]
MVLAAKAYVFLSFSFMKGMVAAFFYTTTGMMTTTITG